MKKTYSLGAELRTLRTICEADSRPSQELLAKLDETHFATEVGRSAFKRILFKINKTGDIPDWVELYSDPGLDVSVKEVLENSEHKPIVSKKNTKKLIARMQEYHKLRMLVDIGSYLEKQLKSPNPIEPDDVIAAVQNKMSSIRHGRQFKMLRLGAKTNLEKHLDKVLKGEAARYIPTGFDGFDSINRGVPTGSAFIIAGPTGSGKSLLAGQLANNMAIGHSNGVAMKVGFFQLEMFNTESLQRDVARVTGTDMTNLLDPLNRLKNSERKEIKEQFLKHNRKIAKRGGQLDYFEFEESVTIEMLLSVAKPYQYDVLVIDYLGLLEGMSDENQWRLMSNAVRTCHLWAKQNDAVVIIAAQLSDEGMLRYSKGMAEHAKLMWSWKKTEQSQATGIYEITQNKARQLSDHNFLLFFDKPHMKVSDATNEHKQAFKENKEQEGKKGKKGGKEKGKSSWKKDDSLTWGDVEEGDDEVPDPVPGPRAKRKPPADAYKGNKRGKNSKGPRDIEV